MSSESSQYSESGVVESRMRFGGRISHKLLLFWAFTVALTLVLVGVVFSFLLSRYHEIEARRSLQVSFHEIETVLRANAQHNRTLATVLARDQDIASIVNLVDRYQDRRSYDALIFDPEKEKLARHLAESERASDRFFLAVHLGDAELVAYAYASGEGRSGFGFRSYRNGEPVTLGRHGGVKFIASVTPPEMIGTLAPKKASVATDSGYRLIDGKAVHVVTAPILSGGRAPRQIGSVTVADVFDDDFVKQIAQAIGYQFSIKSDHGSAGAAAGEQRELYGGDLPNVFGQPGAFAMLGDGARYVGASEIRSRDGRRIAFYVGIDKQALVSGIETVRQSILLSLGLIAVVMLPLGFIFVRRNLSLPVMRLMRGVEAVSRRESASITGFDPKNELGALAEAFNSMAHTVQARENEVRESRDQLRQITDNLPVSIVYVDADQRYRFINRTGASWKARTPGEILGKTVQEVLPQQYGILEPHIHEALADKRVSYEETLTYPDGVSRTVRAAYIPHHDDDGRVIGLFALLEDVTEVMEAEDQLRQAQKMEAIGQLTGGIAHDFNNLLAAVQINAELLSRAIGDPEDLISAILRAAGRGAELTQRLLAFSRRQPLNARMVDLEDLIGQTSVLLRRTLGETVEIAHAQSPDTWTVLADPAQMENALLNLAINARDAMPEGGRVTFECANVRLEDNGGDPSRPDAPPGDYVVLTVSDTGTGMSEEVRRHAFEPFFTTKEVGQGSGLGLSMIYGFVKQSGGDVVIESREGAGTAVKLYLPRSQRGEEDVSSRAGDIPQGRGETVLVLEDDIALSDGLTKMLESLSYKVVESTRASAAFEILESGQRIDVVLSDVVLPEGISGPDFARRVRLAYPGIPVVFMSGYSADEMTGSAKLGSDEVLLNKPFGMDVLARAVRNALAEKARQAE